MSTLHAELTDPYDRPASIPPDEPYVDLGLIGQLTKSVLNSKKIVFQTQRKSEISFSLI